MLDVVLTRSALLPFVRLVGDFESLPDDPLALIGWGILEGFNDIFNGESIHNGG